MLTDPFQEFNTSRQLSVSSAQNKNLLVLLPQTHTHTHTQPTAQIHFPRLTSTQQQLQLQPSSSFQSSSHFPVVAVENTFANNFGNQPLAPPPPHREFGGVPQFESNCFFPNAQFAPQRTFYPSRLFSGNIFNNNNHASITTYPNMTNMANMANMTNMANLANSEQQEQHMYQNAPPPSHVQSLVYQFQQQQQQMSQPVHPGGSMRGPNPNNADANQTMAANRRVAMLVGKPLPPTTSPEVLLVSGPAATIGVAPNNNRTTTTATATHNRASTPIQRPSGGAPPPHVRTVTEPINSRTEPTISDHRKTPLRTIESKNSETGTPSTKPTTSAAKSHQSPSSQTRRTSSREFARKSQQAAQSQQQSSRIGNSEDHHPHHHPHPQAKLPEFGRRVSNADSQNQNQPSLSHARQTSGIKNRPPRETGGGRPRRQQQQGDGDGSHHGDGDAGAGGSSLAAQQQQQQQQLKRRKRREQREMMQSSLLIARTAGGGGGGRETETRGPMAVASGGGFREANNNYGGGPFGGGCHDTMAISSESEDLYADDFDDLESLDEDLFGEEDEWRRESPSSPPPDFGGTDDFDRNSRLGSAGGGGMSSNRFRVGGGRRGEVWTTTEGPPIRRVRTGHYVCSGEDKRMLGLSTDQMLNQECAAELMEFERFLRRNRHTLFEIFQSIKDEERRRREKIWRRRHAQETRELTRQFSAQLEINSLDGGGGGGRSRRPQNQISNQPNKHNVERESSLASSRGGGGGGGGGGCTQQAPVNPQDLLPSQVSLEDRAGLGIKDLAALNARNLALVANGSTISEMLKNQSTEYLQSLEQAYKTGAAGRAVVGGEGEPPSRGGGAGGDRETRRAASSSATAAADFSMADCAPLPEPAMPMETSTSPPKKVQPESVIIRTLTLVSSEKSDGDGDGSNNNSSRQVYVVRVFSSPQVFLVPQMFSSAEVSEIIRFVDSPETLKLYSQKIIPSLYNVDAADAESDPQSSFLLLPLLYPSDSSMSVLSRVAEPDALAQFFRGLRQRCAAFSKAAAESCVCLWIERVSQTCPENGGCNPGTLNRGEGIILVTCFLNEGENLGGLDSLSLGFRVKPEAGTAIFTSVEDSVIFKTLPPRKEKKDGEDGNSEPKNLYLLKALFSSGVAVTPKAAPLSRP